MLGVLLKGIFSMKSKTIVYILGQSYCGSTVLGYALGNHDNVKFLGETKQWIWGRATEGCIDLSCPPSEDVWVDSSKSLWRLRQWYRTPYEVKVIWLKKSLVGCIKSRINRKKWGLVRCIVVPVIARIVNTLYVSSIPHVTVRLKDLQNHQVNTHFSLEVFLQMSIPNLYKPFVPYYVAGNTKAGTSCIIS